MNLSVILQHRSRLHGIKLQVFTAQVSKDSLYCYVLLILLYILESVPCCLFANNGAHSWAVFIVHLPDPSIIYMDYRRVLTQTLAADYFAVLLVVVRDRVKVTD